MIYQIGEIDMAVPRKVKLKITYDGTTKSYKLNKGPVKVKVKKHIPLKTVIRFGELLKHNWAQEIRLVKYTKPTLKS